MIANLRHEPWKIPTGLAARSLDDVLEQAPVLASRDVILRSLMRVRFPLMQDQRAKRRPSRAGLRLVY
jgi:hypothetical protein